jgi:hypothetical protein
MSEASRQLLEFAEEAANHAQRASLLKKDRLQAAQLKTEIDAANRSCGRLQSFQPEIDAVGSGTKCAARSTPFPVTPAWMCFSVGDVSLNSLLEDLS